MKLTAIIASVLGFLFISTALPVLIIGFLLFIALTFGEPTDV